MMDSFKDDLEAFLNERSRENESNTPDYILAQYMISCLVAFETAVADRDEWYNVHLEPGNSRFLKKKEILKG